jgi:hypothetical protein
MREDGLNPIRNCIAVSKTLAEPHRALMSLAPRSRSARDARNNTRTSVYLTALRFNAPPNNSFNSTALSVTVIVLVFSLQLE